MNLNNVAGLAGLLLALPAAAQVPQAIPFARTLDLLVVDSDYDGVWRLADFNQDGDYNDPGEISSFYSDVIGSIALNTPTCIACAPDGTTYVGDSNADIVLALRDQNHDGDCNDPGEHRVFFDSANNASGITMASVMGLTVDALGRVFAAVANAGTTGTDQILLLHDVDQDGDANDLLEASTYCTIPGSAGSLGNSIPTKVVVAPDGAVYYTEVGSTGAVQKGVWRLHDLDNSGDCNAPNERTLFWAPPFVASPFYWGLAVDAGGRFYVTDDSGNEQVWTAFDTDGNGVIDAGEFTLFHQSTGSTWRDVLIRDDGAVLLCDQFTPDRVTALRDLNGDNDALDANEVGEAYHSLQAAGLLSPRGAALLRAPRLDLIPATVPIGTGTSVLCTTANAGDLALIVIAFGLAPPVPLAPWGMVEIDPTFFVSIGAGLADANNQFVVPFAVPSNPAVVGTYAFQSLSGDLFRMFLGNAVVMTVTP